MNGFNYVQREYIPSVDTGIVKESASILDKGHKEAVKAASELKTAIANLDMNEAEEPFKQYLIGEIKRNIDNNTIYGNSSGALDDIVTMSGDVASDPRVLGRLKAQKSYKAYQDSIDKNPQLSNLHKEFFKENNKYYYSDKIDDKTGMVVGGSEWKSTVDPTNVVDTSKLLATAIQMAAIHKGGGTSIRYLGANGKVTKNAAASAYGSYLDSTTSQFESRTKADIWKELEGLIASTPGARESIMQDMEVYAWDADRKTKQNKNVPHINQVTDDNGNILSYDQYLHKLFDEAVSGASYHNTTSSTSVGNAAAARRAAHASARAAGQGRQGASTILGNGNPYNLLSRITMKGDSVVLPGQGVGQSSITLNSARNNINKLLKSKFPNAHISDRGINSKSLDIAGFRAQYKSKFTPQEWMQMEQNLNAYNESLMIVKHWNNGLSDNDKRDYAGVNRIINTGEIIPTSQGGTSIDNNIINNMNAVKGRQSNIVIESDTKTITNLIHFAKEKGVDLNYLGVYLKGGDKLVFSSAQAAMAMSALCNDYNNIHHGWFKAGDHFSIHGGDANGIDAIKGADKKAQARTKQHFYNVGSNLRKAYATKQRIEVDNGFNDKDYVIKPVRLGEDTFTEAVLKPYYLNGTLDKTTYESYIKDAKDAIKTSFSSPSGINGRIFANDISGTAQREISDIQQRNAAADAIATAVRNNRAVITPQSVSNVNDQTGQPITGYYIDIPIYNKDDKGNEVDTGKRRTFFLPDMVVEHDAIDMWTSSPKMLNANKVEVIGYRKSAEVISPESFNNTPLSHVAIYGNSENDYMVELFNRKYNNLNSDAVVNLCNSMSELNSVKNLLTEGITQGQSSTAILSMPVVSNTINNAVNAMCGIQNDYSDSTRISIMDNILKSLTQ